MMQEGQEVVADNFKGKRLRGAEDLIKSLIVPVELRHAVENVVDNSTGIIMNLLDKGGILSAKGLVLIQDLSSIEFNDDLRQRILEEIIVAENYLSLRKSCNFVLDRPDQQNISGRLWLVAPGAEKSFGYIDTYHGGVQFALVDQNRVRKYGSHVDNFITNALTHLVDGQYRAEGINPVIPSQTIAKNIILDICKTFGAGRVGSTPDSSVYPD